MEIAWFRAASCVCTYKNREMTQGVDYEGRASLFIHDLPRGNVSLRLADFRESDLGVYMCRVSSRNETQQITVNVAEKVSGILEDQQSCTVNYQIEESSNKNFKLVVPSTSEEPEVSLGSDLIIMCYLRPEISAVDLEISWSKDTACVCLYKDRQVIEGVLFKDRVSLFTNKLWEGNVSLLLKSFRPSDIGNYHCQVSSKDRTEKITVRVRINPGIQTVSQSPINQDRNVPPVLHERRDATNRTSGHASQLSDSDKRSCSMPSNDHFQLVVPQTAQKAQISLGSEITVPCHLSPEVCASAMQIRWFKETDCVCIYKNGHVIEGRSYKDRTSLANHELGRGNVSLHLKNFSVSDVGDYYCQVINRDTTKQITVGVRIKPEVQPVSQSEVQSIQLMLLETDKVWTDEETDEMDLSALMAELKVNDVQATLLNAYINKKAGKS